MLGSLTVMVSWAPAPPPDGSAAGTPGGGALFYIDLPSWVADGDLATETEAQLEALKQIHRESNRDEPVLQHMPPRAEPAISKQA